VAVVDSSPEVVVDSTDLLVEAVASINQAVVLTKVVSEEDLFLVKKPNIVSTILSEFLK
jgi:hypothetical protein